jgi:hypothetical protein
MALCLVLGCVPAAVEVRPSDNFQCALRGYEGPHITGFTTIPFEGGVCDCAGIPVPLDCAPIESSTVAQS